MLIRGASGFGDAFYLYPIAKHFKDKGEHVTVVTNYPEVFGDGFRFIPFHRSMSVNLDATYVRYRQRKETNVWQDTMEAAGLQDIKFEHWLKPRDCNYKRALILMPYLPSWARDDDYFVPKSSFFISIGNMLNLMGWQAMYLNQTLKSVNEWLELYSDHSLIVTQSSSHLVMAEAWDRKCLCIFNPDNEKSRSFVSAVRPSKVIIKSETTSYCYDTDNPAQVVAGLLNEKEKT